jgi:superfamily I DNA/RNA helicase
MASESTYLAGLNENQAAAVGQIEGPVLVIAGAGSGKTRVVTRRIAYILAAQKAAPEEILAVTFTNKAAGEMRERVAELVGKKNADTVVISTFHSFCLKILREHIDLLGYRKNFTIASESDTRTLLSRALDDIETPEEAFSPGIFREQISLMKSQEKLDNFSMAMPAEESKEEAVNREKYESWLPEIYDRYQSALRAANTVDFDDLLGLVLRLWKEHREIREIFQHKFKYVMVDEYQDTNTIQYRLIQNLVMAHKNLCVVGDDDQSIYGWRGADISNILNFEKDFPGAKKINLGYNYRSKEPILAAANAVIANNNKRIDKEMIPQQGPGRTLDRIVTADEEHEARMVLEWMQNIQRKTGASFDDFAILYRSNVQSRAHEIAMRSVGIPYIVIGGQEFFERAEIRDIVSYLKIIVNPWDEAAFLRVVNMPRRGIGDKTLHTIHDLCLEDNLTLGKGMAKALTEGHITGNAEKGIRNFLGLMKDFRFRFKEKKQPLHEIVQQLVHTIAYRAEIERTAKNPEHASFQWENIQAIVKAIEEYENTSENPTLGGFLDQSSLTRDADRFSKNGQDRSVVTLMTIHSAKGLEFPYVFLVGTEDGIIPHARSLRENTLEEERRLFYVAITRAQRHFTLFETCSRVKHGREMICTPSRFIEEIPKDLVRVRTYAPRDVIAQQVRENNNTGKGKGAKKKATKKKARA